MAKIATVVKSLDGVAESLHDMYAEAQDGKYVLQIEGNPRGFVADSVHEEFRTNNNRLQTDLTTANERLSTFEGIDPTVAKELIATKDDLDRKALIKSGDMEAIIKSEVDKALEPISGQVTTLTEERDAARTALAAKVVDGEILKAGNAFGKMKSGTEDVLVAKAKAAGFTEHNGELRQVVNDAVVFSTETPGQPMEISEWIKGTAAKEYSWVWEPSTGGGGGGTDGNDVVDNAGVKTIRSDDREAFRKNLDDVASGKVKVAPAR